LAVEKLFAETRRAGLAIIERDHKAPGVAAAGVPVFNSAGAITLVPGAVGFQGLLDTSLDGPVVSALKASALKLSKRLGYPGDGR
jgi:DNA-binding IclR family transcriptional regulator